MNDKGDPPTTMVRVQSYGSQADDTALATLSHTEVIEVSYNVSMDIQPSILCTYMCSTEV